MEDLVPTAQQAPQVVAGKHWRATLRLGYAVITVDPEVDVSDVVNELLMPEQRRFWLLQYLHEDELTGWDVYELERQSEPAVDALDQIA